MNQITFDDFLKVDMRVGTVVDAQAFPEARKPAYQLRVDFGAELGIKKTSAQVTEHYTTDELLGKKVIAVVNFPPKQIGKFMSEVLVLGVHDEENKVRLMQIEGVENGGRVC